MLGIYWQADYDFAGGLNTETSERSLCFTPAYSKLRARATYSPPEGNWTASLFGQNITDTRYNEWCGGATGNRSGVYFYRYGRPDTWGLEFNYRWE